MRMDSTTAYHIASKGDSVVNTSPLQFTVEFDWRVLDWRSLDLLRWTLLCPVLHFPARCYDDVLSTFWYPNYNELHQFCKPVLPTFYRDEFMRSVLKQPLSVILSHFCLPEQQLWDIWWYAWLPLFIFSDKLKVSQNGIASACYF